MLRWLLVLLVAGGGVRRAAGIIGGQQAAAPESDAAVVFLQKFDRSARVEGIKNDAKGYYTFLGLRYADPPTGSRRFQRATLQRPEGELAATRTCTPCVQPHPVYPDRVVGTEDCLCINIYSPKLPASEKGSPVLFWIHGGGFRQGSASYYGGEHLTQKDTVLVSVQYRLGSLGFLSNGDKTLSGNLGLLDLSTALQWVLDYIEFFGGDPRRVVTIGQGSGGTAASLLALSPSAREAVRGVAALSGAPLSRTALEPRAGHAAGRAASLADHAGCPREPAAALVACLRNVSAELIVQFDSTKAADSSGEEVVSDATGSSESRARVEGREDERSLPPLVEEAPAHALRRSDSRVPLLTGVVRDETARAVFGKNMKNLKNKLETIPNFITAKVVSPLTKKLADVIPSDLPPAPALPLSLNNYYNFIRRNTADITKGLLKIVEATSDVFFNLPAFQSVEQWNKKAPAYLYRFEYKGNMPKGRHFLQGLPIVGGEENEGDDFIGHGDELAFLFEPLDLEGKPVATSTDTSSQDRRVRDLFTDFIANFAHNVSLTNIYSASSDNPFFKIGSDITTDNDFRLCEMSLWGNIGLQQTSCSLLGGLTDKLPPTVVPVANIVNAASALQPKPSPSGVSSLFNNPFNMRPRY